jgi:GTP cyclohydrolase I
MSEDETVANLVSKILGELGEDVEREGLERTPERVAKALRYLTSGYGKDAKEILNGAMFVEDYDEMVIVKDIDFSSLCEHHLLPFIGKCHVAYMPGRKIVGLSKIPRLVEMFSRRLQVQGAADDADRQHINEVRSQRGVAVVMEAVHLHADARVEKQNSKAITLGHARLFRDRRRRALSSWT